MELKLGRTTEMIDKHNKEIFEGDILYSEIVLQNGEFYLREISEGLGEEIPMRKEFVKTLEVLK